MKNTTDNKPLVIYISGYEKGAGKTTCSLGLIHILLKYYNNTEIAYIKPVSNNPIVTEEGISVDRDVQIIERFSNLIKEDASHTSPVQVSPEFVQAFLSTAEKEKVRSNLVKNILDTIDYFKEKKVIIAEGTGSPAAGSLIGLSNATIASLLGARVIYISGDSYYHNFEPFSTHAQFFAAQKVHISALLFNKIRTKKRVFLEHVINHDFLHFFLTHSGVMETIPEVLGFLPAIEGLPNPSMKSIYHYYKNVQVIGNLDNDNWKIPCHSIRIVNVPAEIMTLEQYIDPQDIVLVEAESHQRIQKVLDFNRHISAPLGGLILTAQKTPLPQTLANQIEKSDIPTFLTEDDAATAELKLLRCFENTKLQLFDDNKAKKIKDLFDDHFAFDKYKELFSS